MPLVLGASPRTQLRRQSGALRAQAVQRCAAIGERRPEQQSGREGGRIAAAGHSCRNAGADPSDTDYRHGGFGWVSADRGPPTALLGGLWCAEELRFFRE